MESNLKIFVFNAPTDDDRWDSDSGVAIVAETQDEAEELYINSFEHSKPKPYKIDEYEIKKGLTLSAFGYDASSLDVEVLPKEKGKVVTMLIEHFKRVEDR